MNTSRTSKAQLLLSGVLVCLAMLAAACGGSDATTTATAGSGSDGSIAVSGSSTVFPIVQLQAERFAAFPISRFLYTYVSVEAAASQPAVATFVDYMMSDEGLTAVEEVGYVALPDDEIAAVKQIWESRTPGKR